MNLYRLEQWVREQIQLTHAALAETAGMTWDDVQHRPALEKRGKQLAWLDYLEQEYQAVQRQLGKG